MTDKDKKLDFDLDFLDKESPKLERLTNIQHPGARPDSVNQLKRNWKKILIIGGIILFIGWAIFSDDSSTNNTNTGSSTSSNANEGSVIVGEYTCSRFHYDRATDLEPSQTEKDALGAQYDTLVELEEEIDSTYVNEYSRGSVDNYNILVEEYNDQAARYRREENNHNARVERYNNYLVQNCTPR